MYRHLVEQGVESQGRVREPSLGSSVECHGQGAFKDSLEAGGATLQCRNEAGRGTQSASSAAAVGPEWGI